MCLCDECDYLLVSHDGFARWRILKPHLREDAFKLIAIRQVLCLAIAKQNPQQCHTVMCPSDPRRQSRRPRLAQLAIPTPKILAVEPVDPTGPDRRLKHPQLLVIITLCPVSQITVWRVFIPQIKINQAGDGAVEYWRRA